MLHLPHQPEHICNATMRTLLPLSHLREHSGEPWQVPLVQEERGSSAPHILLKAVDFYNFANSLGEVVRELHSIYSSAGSSR